MGQPLKHRRRRDRAPPTDWVPVRPPPRPRLPPGAKVETVAEYLARGGLIVRLPEVKERR